MSLEVVVPSNVPIGEQTVSIYDHEKVIHLEKLTDGEKLEISEEEEEMNLCREGQMAGLTFSPGISTELRSEPEPEAVATSTIEIVANQLEFSRSSAARGQKVTISGSGFTPGTNGDNAIDEVLINGIKVDEDVKRFEVTTSGNFTFTATVPIGAVYGGNEVRVKGVESSLAQGTLDVPAASIELDPPESRRGQRVRVTGTGFIANRSVRLYYGDGGTDLSDGDISIGSAFADSTGGFAFTFNVPITAEIGETHKVTAVAEAVDEKGIDVSLRAEADHGPPSASIVTTPEQASPGDTLTISGRNMPQFAQVRPIQINGIDVTPGPNPGTDRNGAFEARVIVPQMELGDQLLRVEVSGVVVPT